MTRVNWLQIDIHPVLSQYAMDISSVVFRIFILINCIPLPLKVFRIQYFLLNALWEAFTLEKDKNVALFTAPFKQCRCVLRHQIM